MVGGGVNTINMNHVGCFFTQLYQASFILQPWSISMNNKYGSKCYSESTLTKIIHFLSYDTFLWVEMLLIPLLVSNKCKKGFQLAQYSIMYTAYDWGGDGPPK